MEEELISIIVPVYNSEKYIEKCIKSLVNQSLNNIEIILIDDGSSDSSLNICKREAKYDNRIRVITQKNLGVSEARNKGIGIARGKYIMFCDSDDFVESNWCEEHYNIIKNNENSLIISGYSIINLRNNKINIKKIFLEEKSISKLDKSGFWNLYRNNLTNSPCNKIYDIKKIKENNIMFDPSLSLGEDLLFNLDYIRNVENIIVINKQLYNYTIRDRESLDNKYYKDLFEIYNRLYILIYKYMEEFNVDLKAEEKSFYKSYLYMLLRVLKNTLSKKNKNSFIEKMKYNSKLLKSDEFKECINKADLSEFNNYYINFIKKGNYFEVYIFDKFLVIKQQLYSIIKKGIKGR